MTEYAYDPELPFAVISNEEVRGRAKFAEEARVFAQYYIDGQVIDTTPKPKIPEGAKHITWGKGDVAYSLYGGVWYGYNHGKGLTEEELLFWIDDDEVTVLVPKEES